MQEQKVRLSSSEKQQAIFNTLFVAPGSLTPYQIHKSTGLGLDSLNYHIRAMVEAGVLVPMGDGSYALQGVYYEEKALKSLEVALELVVSIVSSHSVWDYVDLEKRDQFSVVASNLEHYLRALKDQE